MQRCARLSAKHGGHVIAESPVPRGAKSPFAIVGRERHASFWSYESVKRLTCALALTPVFFDQCMSGGHAMKTTQLACSSGVHMRAQSCFASLRCDGAHKHSSLLGGRDSVTGDFPTKTTAAYTPDTCARLASTFVPVHSCGSITASTPAGAIPVPARVPTNTSDQLLRITLCRPQPTGDVLGSLQGHTYSTIGIICVIGHKNGHF